MTDPANGTNAPQGDAADIEPTMTPDELNAMWGLLLKSLVQGKLVVVVGAGANRAARNPTDYAWSGPPTSQPGATPCAHYAPDGKELSHFLASTASRYAPGLVAKSDEELPRVAQQLGQAFDQSWLWSTVQEALDADYTPTVVHTFLATLPRRLRAAGKLKSYPFIITTNYDDVLETAFEAQDPPEPYDTIVYAPPNVAGEPPYGYMHYRHGSSIGEPIRKAETYMTEIDFQNRTIILKIHGATTRQPKPVRYRPNEFRYVLAEDEYIDFLGYGALDRLMPVGVKEGIKRARFLFLGYSLRDWNIRVFIYQRFLSSLPIKSYAVQLGGTPEEVAMWREKKIMINRADLAKFITEFDGRLEKELTAK